MSSTVFDTHAYIKKLRSAGVPETQAEAQAEALAEALGGEIATKRDLNETKFELKAEMTLVKWMVGFNLAFTAGILMKMLT